MWTLRACTWAIGSLLALRLVRYLHNRKGGMDWPAWCWRGDRIETNIANRQWELSGSNGSKGELASAHLSPKNWLWFQNSRFNTGGRISCRHQSRGQPVCQHTSENRTETREFLFFRKTYSLLCTCPNSMLWREAGEGAKIRDRQNCYARRMNTTQRDLVTS